MIVTTYGTRGSIPVSSREQVRYGGNTTCVRIASQCLPEGHWLVVDAGTGIMPLGSDFMAQKGKELTLLQSHWHHDHTQGLLMAPFLYARTPMHIYGPRDGEVGPGEVYARLMVPPLFPIHLKQVASEMYCHTVECPNASVIIFHHKGGRKQLDLKSFDSLTAKKRQISFKGGAYNIDECLVIKMRDAHHTDNTVCYRFEERPTGQVFVFLTDHENQDGSHVEFVKHLSGADLLLMDTQYTREMYDAMCSGRGHATPDYVARIAGHVGVKALGTTHHDPGSSDERCDQIVATVRSELVKQEKNAIVFGAHDYLTVNVGAVEESVAKLL